VEGEELHAQLKVAGFSGCSAGPAATAHRGVNGNEKPAKCILLMEKSKTTKLMCEAMLFLQLLDTGRDSACVPRKPKTKDVPTSTLSFAILKILL
jgi:hypothetical protein